MVHCQIWLQTLGSKGKCVSRRDHQTRSSAQLLRYNDSRVAGHDRLHHAATNNALVCYRKHGSGTVHVGRVVYSTLRS